MSDDLKQALTEIDGIGDARAEDVLDVVDEHQGDTAPVDVDLGELQDLLEDAVDYHDAGDHGYAAKFVEQALDLVTK